MFLFLCHLLFRGGLLCSHINPLISLPLVEVAWLELVFKMSYFDYFMYLVCDISVIVVNPFVRNFVMSLDVY